MRSLLASSPRCAASPQKVSLHHKATRQGGPSAAHALCLFVEDGRLCSRCPASTGIPCCCPCPPNCFPRPPGEMAGSNAHKSFELRVSAPEIHRLPAWEQNNSLNIPLTISKAPASGHSGVIEQEILSRAPQCKHHRNSNHWEDSFDFLSSPNTSFLSCQVSRLLIVRGPSGSSLSLFPCRGIRQGLGNPRRKAEEG